MQDVDYVSLQAIREEAGMQHYKNGEVLGGTANGSNTIFTMSRSPIVDQNQDDIVSPSDVTVYVNGSPAVVNTLNATAGSVTLSVAPANAAIVTANYAFSPISDATMELYRIRAQKWLNRRTRNIFDFTKLTDQNVPAEWGNMVMLYAAGLIQIRDYGSSVDTDGTSKDGYKKLQLARDLMAEYITDQAEDPTAITPETVSSRNDGDIFPRDTTLGNDFPSKDDAFMRKSSTGLS